MGFALALLLALAGPAALATTATTVEGTAIPVDISAGNQTDPHISRTLVSDTSQSGSSTAIRYRDLASGVSGDIPGDGQDLLSDVFAGTIGFTRFMPGGAAIFAYDIGAAGWRMSRSSLNLGG